MDQCDVLIVGGGPAGSTCARRLEQAGLDVVILDKAMFPRDKTCAGWVTPQVFQSIGLDAEAYGVGRVCQPITGFVTCRQGQRAIHTDYDHVVSYGIRRCEFDDVLLRRSGARLRLGEPLETIQRTGGAWIVNGDLAATLLVGAGGHFCPLARHLGARIGANETPVVAKEIEFVMSAAQATACPVDPRRPELCFTRDLRGYGWVFRKDDVLNVGLGRHDPRGLSRHVDEFMEYLKAQGRIPSALPGTLTGHAYLLYNDSTRPLIGEGVMLIGDAAGLAYPQSGEGIRPAIESAICAAKAILAADGDYGRGRLQDYETAVRDRLGERTGAGHSRWLPPGLIRALGGWLLARKGLTRRIVLDDCFLHRRQAALT